MALKSKVRYMVYVLMAGEGQYSGKGGGQFDFGFLSKPFAVPESGEPRRRHRALLHNLRESTRPLRVTQAMEAGIADHVWSFEQIANLLN
jgi:hypothetical protein